MVNTMARRTDGGVRFRPVGRSRSRTAPVYSPRGTGCPAIEQAVQGLYKEHQPISATDAVRFIPLKGEKYFNRYLIWNRLDNSCLDSVLEVAKGLFTPEAEDE